MDRGIDTRIVGTTPIQFTNSAGFAVKNLGTYTVSYGSTTAVSDGTIAPGGTTAFTESAYFRATAQNLVQIDYQTADEELDGVDITDLEGRVDALEADVAVIGECVNVSNGTGTDQASVLQTALDNIETQGGGVVLLPATDYDGLGITFSDTVYVGMAVDLRGQGKRGTKIRLNASDAGLYFTGSGDVGYSGATNRGGESGGFHIDGNNTATNPLIVRSCNRMFKDMRVSTPANNGTAIKWDQAQNINCVSVEAEDGSHSSSRTVIGMLFDGAACGLNFFGTSLNEFTNGHIVFDASYDAPSGLGIDYSNNITFIGNMIERTDTYNPIIYGKAGSNIRFFGGNITSGGSVDAGLAAEYDLVKLDNTAARSYANIGAGGALTKDFSFYGVSFTGTLDSGSTRYANAFRLASGLQTWHKTLYVSPDCNYSNVNYLSRVDSTSIIADVEYPDDASGGGLVGFVNPLGSGAPNRFGIASASSLTIHPTVKHAQVTGSTTITSIAATYPGHRLMLSFTSTAQVTDGSNLALDGNFTGGADRTLDLRCDGTNWIETGRCAP